MESTNSSAKTLALRDVLQIKAFRILWLAQLVSVSGDLLAFFAAISLIVFHMRGTALQVTMLTVAYILPLAVIGPMAGVFVDRWNAKHVMIASDLVRAVLVLSLAFVGDLRQMCLVFAMVSVVSSFFAPAQQVALRTLMPAEGLLAANALMSQTFYVIRIVSPAVAGALVAWASEKACFYLDSLSFLFSAAMLATLVLTFVSQERNVATLRSITRDFLSGNKFILTHSELAFVFAAMALVIFVQSSFTPLISVYIRDSMGASSFWFGIVTAMIGVGLIAGAQLVNRLAHNRPKTHMVLSGLLTLCFGAALLASFQKLLAAAAGTFTLGLAISLVLVPAQTLSQQATPREMMGRVSSSLLSLVSLAQILGLMLSGYLAQAIGIRLFFLASFAVTLLFAIVAHIWIRQKDASAKEVGSVA